MNIRSKLILVLLLISAASAFATAWLGYRSGSDNLSERIVLQLESLREITSARVRSLFRLRIANANVLSSSAEIIDALNEMSSAKQAIGGGPSAVSADLTVDIDSRLRAWYSNEALRELDNGDGMPVVGAYLPTDRWAAYLQYHYLAANPLGADERHRLDDPGDGSRYSAAHARYHPELALTAESLDFYDLFLIDNEGDVVYSVGKEIDFATNLVDGPYADSGLGRAWRSAASAKADGFVHFEDFSFYAPSANEPALFIATPVFDDGQLIGVLALQQSVESIDGIVNQGGRWEAAGLGESGEIFIVGQDSLLRTTARGYAEDPDSYLDTVRENGVDAPTLERMREQGSTILLQPADSEAVTAAIRGESGVYRIERDYSGRPALAASAPLALTGLDWIIVAEEPLDDAFAPIRDFGRRVLIVSAVLSILLTCLSLLIARLFVRPLRSLVDRAERIADGHSDATMVLSRRDEFGELSVSMQGLVDRLGETTTREREAREKAESRLGRFVPAIVADMIESAADGATDELNVARHIQGAAVVHVRLVGQGGLLRDLDNEALVRVVDDLVQLFDGAVDRTGVEKIRAIGNTYLAVAGLSTRHIDNEERAMNFAVELQATVRRMAAESGEPLAICVGIGMGEISAAVVGRVKLAFDVFGGPVDRAHRLSKAAEPGEIRVSTALAERLSDRWDFGPPGVDPSAGRALIVAADTTGAAAA